MDIKRQELKEKHSPGGHNTRRIHIHGFEMALKNEKGSFNKYNICDDFLSNFFYSNSKSM